MLWLRIMVWSSVGTVERWSLPDLFGCRSSWLLGEASPALKGESDVVGAASAVVDRLTFLRLGFPMAFFSRWLDDSEAVRIEHELEDQFCIR